MPTKTFALQDFNLGGMADSAYQGQSNSLAEVVKCDLHSEPGILKANFALAKESGSTVDGLVKVIVSCSDGKSYLFSSDSGKIWSRTSAGAYALEHTDANGAILGAFEHNGYLYWATAAKAGRWQIGTAWSGASDSWATFTVGNSSFHPMVVKNGILYIGDGYLVAQVDESHVFTANALDLPTKYVIKCLGENPEEILIGTIIASNVNEACVFRWDTWSVSYNSSDSVPESGIDCFVPMDNVPVAICGGKGNIYYHDGTKMVLLRRIPGTYSSTNKMAAHPGAAAVRQGLALIGISNGSGNPCANGVYALGAYSPNYPQVLSLDFVISTGNTSGVDIGAVRVVGDDVLVAWKDTTGGTTYGIDKVNWSARASGAYFTTRVIAVERTFQKTFTVEIAYRSIPSGTSISVSQQTNHAGSYSAVTAVTDAARKVVKATVKVDKANTVQFKMTLGVSGANSPEIESITIFYE